MSMSTKRYGSCYECHECLIRCDDCHEIYCETCEGIEHDRDHRDAERERYAAHAEIDREFNGPGWWER